MPVAKRKTTKMEMPMDTMPTPMSTPLMPQEPRKNPLDSLSKLKPTSYTPVLMVLLIIAAFFLGMLSDKVMYLQAGQGNVPPAQQTAGNQPQQPAQKQNVSNGHFPILGKNDAKVTIIEFADLRCPFCHQFYTETEPQIIKDYVDSGKAKFIFRSYAFLGPASTVAANAAECANDQGKFWAFHNYMYDNQPDESDTSMYTTDKLTAIAGQLGMDTDQFQSCLSANKDNDKVNTDFSDGQKAGVSGTPTIFIDGTPIVGAQPYASFKQIIDQELAKK